MKKKLLALAVAAILAGLLPQAAPAEAAEIARSANQNRQNYSTWANPVQSYLYESGGGLTRVERIGGAVVVEEYDRAFQLTGSRTLELELPLWGGFYAGEEYNFLFFGQNNEEEDNGKEVIRVVKYDKAWNRLGDTGLFGANTIHPFDAGSLRCDEYGGYLYVRTCHEMYTSGDGLNHQANVTFSVREEDMEITDAFYDVMNVSYGYVSHSFNQFILVDEAGTIVAADHGDAYPRSMVLMTYPTKAGGETFVPRGFSQQTTVLDLVTFPGSIGQNSTGASLGGLAETEGGYVVAYNWNGEDAAGDRDVYLAYVGKDMTGGKTAKFEVPGSARTPQLAPTGPEGGYLLWAGVGDGVSYAAYDAQGNVGAAQTAPGALSDCAPIPYGEGVVWYVTDGEGLTFYTLDGSGLHSFPAEVAETPSGWATDEVEAAIAAGLVPTDLRGGYQREITRLDFCRLMVTLVEEKTGEDIDAYLVGKDLAPKDPFTDTDHPAVLAAHALGIVNGTSATTFNPGGSITRQEAAAMLARTAKVLGLEPGERLTFGDTAGLGAWAREGIDFVSGLTDAVTGKAVMGGSGGNFSPQATYSREQAYITALRLFHVK